MNDASTKGQQLTKWERGQVLVKAADALSECTQELQGYEEEHAFIKRLRRELGNYFNKEYLDEMGFGL